MPVWPPATEVQVVTGALLAPAPWLRLVRQILPLWSPWAPPPLRLPVRSIFQPWARQVPQSRYYRFLAGLPQELRQSPWPGALSIRRCQLSLLLSNPQILCLSLAVLPRVPTSIPLHAQFARRCNTLAFWRRTLKQTARSVINSPAAASVPSPPWPSLRHQVFPPRQAVLAADERVLAPPPR